MARVLVWFSLICAFTLSGLAQEGDITTLAPGSSTRQQISKAQRHSYRLSLDADQYVRMTIYAGAGDLGVTLYGPAQQKLTETVCRQAVPARVSLLAQAPASYVLDVRSLETEEFAGQYEITVEAARQATEADAAAVLGERAYAEGELLRAEQREEYYRK